MSSDMDRRGEDVQERLDATLRYQQSHPEKYKAKAILYDSMPI